MRHDCVLAAQLESMSEGDDGAGIEESNPHSAVSTQPNRKTPTTEARRHGGKRVNKTLTTKVTQEHKGTPRKSGKNSYRRGRGGRRGIGKATAYRWIYAGDRGSGNRKKLLPQRAQRKNSGDRK